jgi:hypothetical protein
MKYYLDTEFHEYHKQPKVCGIKIGKAIPTIDLISIGIVSEDLDKPAYGGGKLIEVSYYAISKDFNIKDAWNSFQWKNEWVERDPEFKHTIKVKEYWLRDNVLKPIFIDLLFKDDNKYRNQQLNNNFSYAKLYMEDKFTYKNFTKLINKYGKTNKQIAKEINEFVGYSNDEDLSPVEFNHPNFKHDDVQFYAYYADYDWVVFCQLFGKMIDLPNGFPRYCNDLKQELDRISHVLLDYNLHKNPYALIRLIEGEGITIGEAWDRFTTIESIMKLIKNNKGYPKQDNEHNALDDAIFNKNLHNFINSL